MYPIALADMQQIAPCTWEIPRSFRNDMRVNARLYASREMVEHLLAERSLEQLVNTATFPGVQEPVLAMPDIHQGYGFPIGGVVAVRRLEVVRQPRVGGQRLRPQPGGKDVVLAVFRHVGEG